MVWTQPITERNLREMFTLSSELPSLADLVFWFYYIDLQVVMLFYSMKTPKSMLLKQNIIHKY